MNLSIALISSLDDDISFSITKPSTYDKFKHAHRPGIWSCLHTKATPPWRLDNK